MSAESDKLIAARQRKSLASQTLSSFNNHISLDSCIKLLSFYIHVFNKELNNGKIRSITDGKHSKSLF
jgi:hypothetical protein